MRDKFYPVPKLSQRLFRHFAPGTRGQTVLKINGTYATYDCPTNTDMDSATEIYQGGHVYTVTTAQAAALTAAGYGSGIS